MTKKLRQKKRGAAAASATPAPPPVLGHGESGAAKPAAKGKARTINNIPRSLPANPPVTRPLHLLTLPLNVLSKLCGRSNLPPSALIQLACASKAAAEFALPELYSNLFIGSFWALPRLCLTLQARPDLAHHVQSLTGGKNMWMPCHMRNFYGVFDDCAVHPGSPVTSVSTARALGLGRTPELPHEEMPMPYLVLITTICPRLKSVDLSKSEHTAGENSKLVLFGLLDLAAILRARRGKFVAHPLVPFSCVLVNNFSMSKPVKYKIDMMYVTAIDWGKKRVGGTTLPTIKSTPDVTECIPIRDLVGPDANYARWTLGDMHFATAHRVGDTFPALANAKGHVAKWIGNPRKLWTHAGLSRAKDHIFDFSPSSKQGIIKGKVALFVHYLWTAEIVLKSINVDPHRQCKTLFLDGPFLDPDYLVEPQILTMYKDMFAPMKDRPMSWVTDFYIDVGFFIDYNTAEYFVTCLDKGMPNLTTLGIRRLNCPIDFILYALDPLLRRDPARGKRLKTLAVSGIVPSRVLHISQLSSMVRFPLPTLPKSRSLLDATRATPNHLESLTLQVEGPGMHCLDERRVMPPTVAIHPGLLHGLNHVTLQQVYLYILPSRLALPTSPSFYPIDHVCDPQGSLFTRTMLSFNHLLYLPRITNLSLSSNAVLPSLVPVDHFHELIPRCPNVESFGFIVDGAHAGKSKYDPLWIAPDSIVRALSTLPNVHFALLGGFAGVTEEAMRAIRDGMFGAYPREARACPRLGYVMVDAGVIEHQDEEWFLERSMGRVVELPEVGVEMTAVERAELA